MTGKNKKHVGEEKNQKSKNTLHEKEKNKQKKGENVRDIPSNVRGINGGNLVTPTVSSFHDYFLSKMEKSIFGCSREKMSKPQQKSFYFSLPTK